jgi:quercetin dioxygenase-like cupin family protein
MVYVKATEIKKGDLILQPNGEKHMVKEVVTDDMVKISLYGRFAVYHDKETLLPISVIPVRNRA